MAQTVLTQYVNEPTILQPFTIYELDWVQTAISAITTTICQGLQGVNFSGSPFIMNGYEQIKHSVSGTVYNYDTCLIYEPTTDEIYYFPGATNFDASLGEYFAVNIAFPNPGDPTMFSDGNARNVMQLRYLGLSNSPTNAVFQFSGLTYMRGGWDAPGLSPTAPPYQNNWSGNLFGPGGLFEYKFNNINQRVEFQGGIINASNTGLTQTILTLPVKFRPSSTRNFSVIGHDGSGTNRGSAAIQVTPSGVMTAYWIGTPPSSTTGIWLDGIGYSINQ